MNAKSLKFAKLGDLKTVYGLFQKYREVFPHVRQDALRRRIAAKQCVFHDGVVITFQQYKKRTRVGNRDIPAGAIMLHQILNGGQFNGAGKRVFNQFHREVVQPSGGDLYLTVRKANKVACGFYERNGMQRVGKVTWSKGTLPGVIYFKGNLAETSLKNKVC